MIVSKTKIEGAFLIAPDIFRDNRGYFFESYSCRDFIKAGLVDNFVQDNRSLSSKGTLRGLHYQAWPRGQVKLIECLSGAIKDVIVDLNPISSSYLQWQSFDLNHDNKCKLYIPSNCAHGFLVLSDIAEVQYKCSWYYEPQLEKGYAWNDPTFGVEWGITDPILSERDKHNPCYTR